MRPRMRCDGGTRPNGAKRQSRGREVAATPHTGRRATIVWRGDRAYRRTRTALTPTTRHRGEELPLRINAGGEARGPGWNRGIGVEAEGSSSRAEEGDYVQRCDLPRSNGDLTDGLDQSKQGGEKTAPAVAGTEGYMKPDGGTGGRTGSDPNIQSSEDCYMTHFD
ncbi:hypothetical protein NDU88_001315 [Pleurodeles waltl]|uniref:Uncharacterized protein n=1 Tax=Pleurodeles waltl TaxID=8319 RepID=A0AAV7U8Z7_PLEWA|nr:hypothetical protein NDU88_001315 [Pleurodeles waltl]